MSLGPHPRILLSIAITEKLRIAREIGRRSKYGWSDLIHSGDTICIPSLHNLKVIGGRLTHTQRWNAARAFATYLDAHPELYRNRNVIELGAGGGLPGIVTALNGANTVCLGNLVMMIVVVADPLRSC